MIRRVAARGLCSNGDLQAEMNLNMEPIDQKKRGKLFYISTSASDDQQPSSVERRLSDDDDDSSWSEYSESGEEQSQPLRFDKLPKRSMSAAGGFTYYLSNKSIYPSEDKLSLLSTMFNSQQNLANKAGSTGSTSSSHPSSSRRLPPPPPTNQLDSDDDDDDDDGGLEFNARNSKRIEQLAIKHKRRPDKADASYASTLVGSDDGNHDTLDKQASSDPTADAPISARPQSPRTIRRNMLASELSESLRKSILWERETRARMLLGGHNNSSGMLNAKLQEKLARQEAAQQQQNGIDYAQDAQEAHEVELAAHNARVKNTVNSINTSHRRYKSTPERSDNQYPHPHKMLSTTTIGNQPSSSSIAGRNLTENDLSKYHRKPQRTSNRYLSSSPDYHG